MRINIYNPKFTSVMRLNLMNGKVQNITYMMYTYDLKCIRMITVCRLKFYVGERI